MIKGFGTLQLAALAFGFGGNLIGTAHADVKRVATLTGTCIKVTAMNTPADPAKCSNKLANTEFSTGRIGFTFVITGKDGSVAVISFFGDGAKQIHTDKDHVTQPIDRVAFTFMGSTDNLSAAFEHERQHLVHAARAGVKSALSEDEIALAHAGIGEDLSVYDPECPQRRWGHVITSA